MLPRRLFCLKNKLLGPRHPQCFLMSGPKRDIKLSEISFSSGSIFQISLLTGLNVKWEGSCWAEHEETPQIDISSLLSCSPFVWTNLYKGIWCSGLGLTLVAPIVRARFWQESAQEAALLLTQLEISSTLYFFVIIRSGLQDLVWYRWFFRCREPSVLPELW